MGGVLSFFATGPDRPLFGDVQARDAAYRRYRLQVMIGITGGYMMSYTCRLAMAVVKKPIIDQGVFTPAQLGLIGSALFYSIAFAKLTNGVLGDHANIKRFFAFGLLLSALMCFGMGLSSVLWLSVLLWGLNGWFQGFGAPSGVISLTNWFSNHERGRYYGIWSISHAAGTGLTFLVVGAIVSAYGWRAGFMGPGVLCVLTAIVAYVLVQDRPRTLGLPAIADWKGDHAETPAELAAEPKEPVLKTQLSILKQPAMWALALSSALMYVTRYGMDSWGNLYLQEDRHYAQPLASWMLTLGTLAGVAGCIVFGFVSDTLFRARRPPANLIFALIELAGLALIFKGPHEVWAVETGFVLFGFGINGLITSLGGLFATDICPKRVAGAALGFTGVFSYLGAAMQENVSGLLIQKGMTVANGVRHYDFSGPVLFWVGASVVSMLLAASLWRARLKD